MTTAEDADNPTDEDDITLAASSDMVAMIRQHAAELRHGQDTDSADDEDVPPQPGGATPAFEDDVTQPARAFHAPYDRTTPVDDDLRAQLALAKAQAEQHRALHPAATGLSSEVAPAPAATPSPAAAPARGPSEAEEPASLMAGSPPPSPSTSFWDPTDRSREVLHDLEAVGSKQRFPVWFWIGAAALIFMVVLAIAISIATSGGGT